MITLRVVPLDGEAFQTRFLLAQNDEPQLTLGQLLTDHPAFGLEPIAPELLDVPISRMLLHVVPAGPDVALYWPPGLRLDATASTARPSARPAVPERGSAPDGAVVSGDLHPESLTERESVLIAYDHDITRAAAYLDAGLSVLMRCEKLLVEHLAKEIAGRAGREPRFVEAAKDAGPAQPGLGGGRRAELLSALQRAVRDAKPTQAVVVPHIDLLAGGSDGALSAEARELTDVLYERSDCTLLAFTDPSLTIPEVLANRFAVRLDIDILPRDVAARPGGRIPIGQALVTRAEAELFRGFDGAGLYKYIAGLNPVRLRHALRFAFHQHSGDAPQDGALAPDARRAPDFSMLIDELRTFKAKTSRLFEVPNVPFERIGGYPEVKRELQRALAIVGGAAELPEHLRHDLVPRGFILHGPPGTGKTLFAKAIASALNATILVVSGPEINDMYHGESERKVRELFAEARRNAPAVIVFDEFDSIAGRRSGFGDGGNRAGNAIVAQLLTELDGFRPEVPVLIVGTTNRIDLIDDALLRPSRFKPIKVELPDEPARREIAAVHAAHFGIGVSAPLLDAIARSTDKLNGDEIRSIFRDARADELVGSPARRADARRLGELLGALRRAQQERDVAPGSVVGRRPGGRPMVVLAPRRAAAGAEVTADVTAEATAEAGADAGVVTVSGVDTPVADGAQAGGDGAGSEEGDRAR